MIMDLNVLIKVLLDSKRVFSFVYMRKHVDRKRIDFFFGQRKYSFKFHVAVKSFSIIYEVTTFPKKNMSNLDSWNISLTEHLLLYLILGHNFAGAIWVWSYSNPMVKEVNLFWKPYGIIQMLSCAAHWRCAWQ